MNPGVSSRSAQLFGYKSVTYNEIFIFRFEDGPIAETRGVVDVLSQMKQLGAIP